MGLAVRARLVEDHQLAQKLAVGMAERFPGSIDPGDVDTNLVRIEFDAIGLPWEEVQGRLTAASIKVNPPIRGGWRVCTHRDVDESDVERLFAAVT